MSDAPERIWTYSYPGREGREGQWLPYDGSRAYGPMVEYRRADISATDAQIAADLLAKLAKAESRQDDLVRAGYLAGLEAAAKYHDEIYEHDAGGIEYASMVGIPLSNYEDLERSCRQAEMDAKAIRALDPDPEAITAIAASVTDGE